VFKALALGASGVFVALLDNYDSLTEECRNRTFFFRKQEGHAPTEYILKESK